MVVQRLHGNGHCGSMRILFGRDIRMEAMLPNRNNWPMWLFIATVLLTGAH